MTTTAAQASIELRQGKVLDVDVDVAEHALALAVPYLFRHIDPTSIDGKGALARFRKLADNAGLPHDSQVFSGWFAIRALRVIAGDAVVSEIGCPVTDAILAKIGTAPLSSGHVITGDASKADAVTITRIDPQDGETGAIATPAGTIRVPGSSVTCPVGSWATALSAVDKVAGSLGRKAYDMDPDAVVELEWLRPAQGGSVDADSIHEDWTPEIAFHPDLMAHPARLIQSATLATVEPPIATYRPRLTRRVIKSGRISDAQFEFLVAAGEAHGRHLPVDPTELNAVANRTGIYLADGTGAGKTNEMLGVVLDNMIRGRRKAVLVLAKRRHLSGFIEAWASMGRDRKDFNLLWEWKSDESINASKGILVTTYSMLREQDADDRFLRVEQIARWAGADFEGPMLFDEAQEMRNAAGDEDKSGKGSDVSMQGVGGIALQDALPEARVVYGSATGATDVHNLAYCVRLGLWGEGTCFKDRLDFIRTFEEGGIADLEQVTLSLKASGVYVARSLSFDGVEVVHLPVTLTADERRMYNDAATMWSRLYDAFKQNAKRCNVPLDSKETIADMRKRGLKGVIPYSRLSGIYEANRKVSMGTLIAAFKARGVISDAKDKIEKGMSVVIQMQNTYEAQLNRALIRTEKAQDIKLEPAELISFAEQLPTQMYKITQEPNPDPKKNQPITVYTPVVDAQGNPVEDPQSVAIRNTLMAEARALTLPLPPLDQIMLAFGPARISEVTGRSRRLIPDKPFGQRDGATGVKVEDRIESDRTKDIQAFHDAEKPILAFSTGAGGSSLSYHARIGSKAADRRRMHYLIQLGHRADEVTQGIGRTHRSDQTVPPIVSLVTVDLPADRLYASRIVSALFKMGALTQGHRHATSNGMFDERDCMDGPYAEGAWEDLKTAIMEDGIDGYDWPRFMQDMGLTMHGEIEVEQWGKYKLKGVLGDTNKLINRVAALTDRRQNLIFDKLREFIDKRIEQAIADGTFTAGPQTLKATSLTVVTDRRVATDRVHGGYTRLMRLRKRSEIATVPFVEAYRRYLKDRSGLFGADFVTHRTTAAVALRAPGKPIITALGDKIATWDMITPTGMTNRPMRVVDREPWYTARDMDNIEKMWNAAVESAPSEATSFVSIVADALLPVWPMLRAAGTRNAVLRMQTDDGRQIVGRPISAKHYGRFCAEIGESARPDDAEIDEIIGHLKAGSKVALSSDTATHHYLMGEWSGGRMTGVSIELAAGVSDALAVALDALPGAGSNKRPGSICQIATRTRDIPHALGTVMSASPAIFVEEAIQAAKPAKKAAKTAAAPTQAAVTHHSAAAQAFAQAG